MESVTQQNALESFRQAMITAGIEPPDSIKATGKLERFSTNGRRLDDAGWLVFHPDGIPSGAFGDWRSGISGTWTASVGRELNPDELRIQRERVEKARREAVDERRRRANQAASIAQELIRRASPAHDHPYLLAKQVTPAPNLFELPKDIAAEVLGYSPQSKGERLHGRILVVPITINDEISSCELIDESGQKSAIAGGRKAGGIWAPTSIADDATMIAIAEGVATALSVQMATGLPVVAALSAGNLESAAQGVRDRFPEAKIVICADLDKTTGGPNSQASAAARSVGGILAIPTIAPNNGTDFNDLAVTYGLGAVTDAFDLIVSPSQINQVTGVTEVTSRPDRASRRNPEKDPRVTRLRVPPQDLRPQFVVLDEWHEESGRRYRPGVWFFGVKSDRKGNTELTETWISSPLHIVAVTHDQQDNNLGRLLQFKTTLNRWREWAMPCELLAGDLAILRAELLSMGVELDPLSRGLFAQYLNSPPPKQRIHCALSIGWCPGGHPNSPICGHPKIPQ